jgi:hypothetical protein
MPMMSTNTETLAPSTGISPSSALTGGQLVALQHRVLQPGHDLFELAALQKGNVGIGGAERKRSLPLLQNGTKAVVRIQCAPDGPRTSP